MFRIDDGRGRTSRPGAATALPLSCLIAAEPTTVFRLLAEVELWPAIFPHIASARVLRRHGQRRVVTVRASWRGVPVGWRALQVRDPGGNGISFRHLNALSRGSGVVWTITPEAGGVRVAVSQQVKLHVPVIGGWLARHLLLGHIGPEMAHVMLARLKEVAEGGTLAGRS